MKQPSRMRSGSVALFLMLGVGCSTAVSSPDGRLGANEARELKAGMRVRVHLADPKGKVVSELMRVSADTLVVAPEEDRDGLLTLSAPNLRRVQ